MNVHLRSKRLYLTVLITVLIVLFAKTSDAQSFFVENKGQWNEKILFRAELDGAIIYLTDDGYTMLQYDREKWADWMEKHQDNKKISLKKWIDKKDGGTLHFHNYNVRFEGAVPGFITEGLQSQNFVYNFITGNDPSKHASGVHAYRKVFYRDIYPNIDVEFVLGSGGFKYNLHLHPGADPDDIKLLVEGADHIDIENEYLTIHTSLEDVRETIPVSYVVHDGQMTEKNVKFNLIGNTISFTAEEWKNEDYIIIDPEVIFSTYSGSSADNFGFTATYDNSGNLYAGGITTSADRLFDPNGRYPATTGAFDVTYNGGFSSQNDDYGFFACDITISKYSADGTSLIYATYIGGSHNEYPHSLIVDGQGQLVIFGTTFSSDYPTSQGAYQPNKQGGSDIIITKLSADGSSLVGSTFIGGNADDGLNQEFPLKYFYADDFRGEVNVNDAGEVYVASCTYSADFPVTQQSFQTTLKGNQEGVVIKMNNNLTSLEWATFLGGSAGDALYSIDFDRNGDIFIAGGTESRNFPGTEKGKYVQYFGGVSDGMIAVLSDDGKTLKRATYWGTDAYDQIMSLEIDDANKVYVVGQSQGRILEIGKTYKNSNSGQFVTRFSNDLNEIDFSTVFGSGDGLPDITINAFLVDRCRKIFISGWGGSTSFQPFSSTRNLPITSDAAQKTTDGSDFYLIVLAKDAEDLLYATYFGGNLTSDHVDGGTSRFDKKGVVYQSVCASCRMTGDPHYSDFPTTNGSYAPDNLSPRCSNAAFKIAFGNLNRTPQLTDTFFEVRALDELTFDYTITDPDRDTIDVIFIPEDGIADNLIDFDTSATAIENMTQPFRYIPDCDDVTGDTARIKVYVSDRGCPGSKDSFAYIKILVLPPPVIDPPETVCLLFTENGVELNWTGIVDSGGYFEETLLYKVSPDGSEEVVYIHRSTQEGKFIDIDVTSPRTRNYTYYLRVKNKCGKLGPSSISVSTVKESEAPIEVTIVLTATVEDNRNILVRWLHSKEEDFGSYEIYRYENFSGKNDITYIGATYERNDTVFVDEDVDVHSKSYCYLVVVRDRCGHTSANSNKGCTIVLDGKSLPFAFDIWWNEYNFWENGVQQYNIYRAVDTGYLRHYDVTGPENLFYNDDTLNYDWGGYWYEVLADERAGYNETSRSNRIYLVQPPLLHVPNAFTPNNDNLNEFWGIVPVFVKTYHLQVYNRWGERVYESTEKKVLWDGFYKGRQAANNVYIYTITFSGWDHSVHHRKGTVTVLK